MDKNPSPHNSRCKNLRLTCDMADDKAGTSDGRDDLGGDDGATRRNSGRAAERNPRGGDGGGRLNMARPTTPKVGG